MSDPLSMLDVLEESRQRAMDQREAAVKFMIAHALRAILDGVDPREVAERCGFVIGDEPPQPTNSPYAAMLFGMGEAPPRPPLERFAEWLGEGVKGLITEGAR